MAVKSYNKKEKKRRKIFRILGAGVLITVFVWFMLASMWRIHGAEVVGAKHTNISQVHAEVRSVLDKRVFWILPGNQMYLYDKSFLKNEILQNFPSVEKVEVKVSMHGQMTVSIVDRRALGVWCDTNDCYFYDDNGVLFKKAFKYTGILFTAWNNVVSADLAVLGTKVPCRDICLNEKLLAFLHDKKIDKVEMNDEMLLLKSGKEYYIKAGFDATTTIKHLEELEKKEVGMLKTLEYADVRFPHKIFYKIKGE